MLHQLGAGALGPVVRAADETDGHVRATALKVLVFDLTPERAQECARLLQRLAAVDAVHPAVVPIVGAGCEGSLIYLAQAYVSGVPLDALLRDRGPLTTDETLGVLRQLAAAIDASAAAGVLHGRLHARDVLVSLPNAWMTGHGVAAALEECGIALAARRPYAAPERQARQSWDVTADVYSLGVIAYEMLTGRRMGATADAVSLSTAPLDAPVREVLTRELAADPGARYQSATEFVEALAAAMAASAAALPAAPAAEASERFSDAGADLGGVPAADEPPAVRSWLPVAVMVVLGVLAGFGGGYLTALSPVPKFLGSEVPRLLGSEVSKFRGSAVQRFESSQVPKPPPRDWTDAVVTEAPKPSESPRTPEPSNLGTPEPRNSEPRNSEPRNSEPRTFEPRNSEPRNSEPRNPEPRNFGTQEPRNPGTPELRKAASFERSTLAVRTRPEGARVFLNGRPVGVSPLVLTDVAAGAHRVGLELAGYQRWTSLVRVGSGTRHSITASLDRVRK